ncbi:MAG: flippase [Candidatus Marinimicrobia bacterium]|nr:flippase [Candidatus Neomarinimicrobiota bacterium]
MNTAQKVAKNTGVIFAGQLINMALNLIAMIWLARYLGEVKFGMFSFVIVFINFFAIAANFGMKPIIVREISRDIARARRILGTTIIIKFLLSIVSILLAYIVANLLGYSQELIILIVILAFNIFTSAKLQTFRVVFESIFEANLSMEYPILLRMIDAVFLVGLIVLLTHFNCSLRTIALFYVLSTIPGFFLTISLSINYFKPHFRFDFQLAKWLLFESLPLALYVGLSRLYTSADVFILKMLKDDAAVGYYSAAFRLIYPLNFISAAIVMSLFPLMSKYYQDSKEKLIKSFNFGIKILVLIGLALCLGATFLHERLVIFLYTDKYLSSSLSLMILMWAQLFAFLNFFLVDFNTSVNQQKHNTYVAVFMFLANVGLNLLLVPIWGVNGASFAKLITVALGFSILYFYAFQKIGVSLLPIMKKTVPIAVCFSIWLYLVRDLNLIFIFMLSPISFAFLVLFFRFFSESESKVLKELFIKI